MDLQSQESISGDASHSIGKTLPYFEPKLFRRQDEQTDSLFYQEVRLVNHIDDAAISALRDFYAKHLPANGHILDLMSSWVSHLPESAGTLYESITGLGLNKTELAENPVLTSWDVHDLNNDLILPYDDLAFDGVVTSVSIQYLVKPVEIFAEVGRVLRPGSLFAVIFSNRMFPTKAVAIWQALSDYQRAQLVKTYFRLAGNFDEAQFHDLSPALGRSDPLFAVVAKKMKS